MRVRPKRLALVIIGLSLFLAAGCYLYFWHYRPIGRGPVGHFVQKEAFTAAWTQRPVLLVGFGDSVTAGFGARRGYGYFDRLVENPPDEFADLRGICLKAVIPNLAVTNLAVSGSVSSEHVEKQLPKLGTNSNSIGLVVITTGGNDLIHNYGRTPPREDAIYGATWDQAKPWIESFEKRLEVMISQVEEKFPAGYHIFLANIFDPTDGLGDIQHAGLPPWPDGMKILAAYNQIIARCTEKHRSVHLVDIHGAFLSHGIHCTQFWRPHYDFKDPHYWFYENLEDPNERGYDAIRRLFLIEMSKFAHDLK